MKHSKEKFSQT